MKSREAYLLVEMQHKHDNGQYQGSANNRCRDPRNPFSRAQKEFSSPHLSFAGRRQNDEFGVGDDALQVDIVIHQVDGGPDKKVFNVIVRPSEANEGIRRLKGLVRGLRKLSHCNVYLSEI